MNKFYMDIKGSFWELYDCKGNLWTLCSIAEYDLNSAVRFFNGYLEGRSVENPVILEFSEIFLQG